MEIKVLITETKTGEQIVECITEISQEDDLEREVSVAVKDARMQGFEPFGSLFHVDKA